MANLLFKSVGRETEIASHGGALPGNTMQHVVEPAAPTTLVHSQRRISRQDALVHQTALRRAYARIAELEQALEAVKAMIHEDMLTGLLNRRGFNDAIEREISRAGRQNLPLCVVAFDIDNFKTINDRFGHDAGDAALAHVARIVKSTLRMTDIFARIGGEEFIIALPGATPEQAVHAAERAQKALHHAAVPLQEHCIAVTFSAGVTGFTPGEALGALLKRADEGLYEAKRRGKDCVVLV